MEWEADYGRFSRRPGDEEAPRAGPTCRLKIRCVATAAPCDVRASRHRGGPYYRPNRCDRIPAVTAQTLYCACRGSSLLDVARAHLQFAAVARDLQSVSWSGFAGAVPWILARFLLILLERDVI